VQGGQPVPDTCQEVKALVLKSTTPRAIALLAAGHHQSIQGDAQDVATADILEAFAEAAQETASKKGNPLLADDDVYRILFCHGLHKGDTSMLKADSTEVNEASAWNAYLKAVCFL